MNSSQCVLFRDLSHNVEYHVLVAIKGVICLAGLIRITNQWRHYGARFLVHENTKLLFSFYYALNIKIASLYGFLYFSELVRLRFDCFLFDFRYVLLTRGLVISTVFAAQHVILVMSFERLYSTIFPAYFEKNSSKFLAAFLALTAITSTYFYTLFLLSDNFRLFMQLISVAFPSPHIQENNTGFKALMASMVLSNCISLITLCMDLYLNFIRKPASSTSLSISYQVSENRRIVLALIPIELTQTLVLLFASVSLMIYGKLRPNPTPMEELLFIELVTFTAYVPLILTFFIKRSAEKRLYETRPIDPEIDHFESLKKSWEK